MSKVDFEKQLRRERNFYLGKTGSKIPGTDMTLEEAREAFKKRDAEFQRSKFVRREKVLLKRENPTAASMVVPGVIVDMEMPKQQIVITEQMQKSLADASGALPLPTDDELKNMTNQQLTDLAGMRQIEVKTNDAKDVLIAKLKGEFKDESEKADTGSSTGSGTDKS